MGALCLLLLTDAAYQEIKMNVFIYGLFVTCIQHAFAQFLPSNPCPSVFQYINQNGIVMGQIQVPNDGSGVYEISVNMSVAAVLQNQNIKIMLASTVDQLKRGANPTFRIQFPVQLVIPKITNVLFNGQLYCSGPPEIALQVTNLWALGSYRLNSGQPIIGSSNPFGSQNVINQFGSNLGSDTDIFGIDLDGDNPQIITISNNKPGLSNLPNNFGSTQNNGLQTVSNTPFNTQFGQQNSGFGQQNVGSVQQKPSTSNNFNQNGGFGQQRPSSSNNFNQNGAFGQQSSSSSGNGNIFNQNVVTNRPITTSAFTNTIETTKKPFISVNKPRPQNNSPLSIDFPSGQTSGQGTPFVSNEQRNPETPKPFVNVETTTASVWQNFNVGSNSASTDDRCGMWSTNDQYPWLVAILQYFQDTYKFKCNGNLISSKHVISAGHCFMFDTLKTPPEDFTCVLGKPNVATWSTDSIKRDVEEIHIHESYKPNTGDNDIAVILLNTDLQFSNIVRPICMWSQNDDFNFIGSRGDVVGWQASGGSKNTLPKKTQMSVVSNEDCLRSDRSFIGLTSSNTFCAGENSIGGCSFDSGATFMLKRNNVWYIRGVFTYGILKDEKADCDTGKNIVFVDFKKYLPWIKQQLLT